MPEASTSFILNSRRLATPILPSFATQFRSSTSHNVSMSSADDSSNENTHDPVQNAATTVNELVADLQKAELQSSDDTMEQAPSTATMDSSRPSRPIIYTRKQLLHLSNSPLVKVPDGMPSFASWFGCVAIRLHLRCH